MKTQKIDQTSRYLFERWIDSQELDLSKKSKTLRTTYIHKGEAILEHNGGELGTVEKIVLKEGNGFVVTPGVEYNLIPSKDFVGYSVSSEVEKDKPIIEIIDDEGKRQEVPLPKVKIITNPKKVNKPWGHELWILWTKDYHVMKQIGMIAGNQSSLQFHREKLETNYLEEGKADVIDGYKLDPQAPEIEVENSSKGIDFNQYRKSFKPGDFWTSEPGTVHRVISKQDYLAYEVSTPELDDVIRLQDDSQRESGLIKSEHKTK